MENSNWKLNSLRTTESRRRKMKAKILIASLVGAASLGMMQTASAAWDSTACPSNRPCVQYGTSDSFNVSTPGQDDWHGIPNSGTPEDPFVFSGSTTLTCDGVPLQCDLSLKGYVNITPGNPDLVGIKVVDFQVKPGDALCSLVSVSGFPWYIAENSEHTPSANPGLPYDSNNTPPIDLIGSIGPIGVSVPLFANFSGGHMHDITYNNVDTFSFGGDDADPNIYINDPSIDTPTGCMVSGDLVLQAPGTSLTIY